MNILPLALLLAGTQSTPSPVSYNIQVVTSRGVASSVQMTSPSGMPAEFETTVGNSTVKLTLTGTSDENHNNIISANLEVDTNVYQGKRLKRIEQRIQQMTTQTAADQRLVLSTPGSALRRLADDEKAAAKKGEILVVLRVSS